MLLKFGPLTQVWTMRFESKHRVSKIAARASCSKVNICKTVALKNQLVLNDVLIKNKPFQSIVMGKKSKPTIRVPQADLAQFHLLDKTVKWVTIKGQKIINSSILTIDLCSDAFRPLFGKVENIYVFDGRIFFSVLLYETIDFDLHYYSYKVHMGTKKMFIEYTSVISLIPNTITIMRNSSSYITLKVPLD